RRKHSYVGTIRRIGFGHLLDRETAKEKGNDESGYAKFNYRSAPTCACGTPPGINGSEKESYACPHPNEAQRVAGIRGKYPRDHGRRGRVIETAAEPREDHRGKRA